MSISFSSSENNVEVYEGTGMTSFLAEGSDQE